MSNTQNPFKVGDAVTVIREYNECYIGCKGTIVEISTNDPNVAIVKLNSKLYDLNRSANKDANNNITNNTRQFYNDEIELDKNAIVTSILNDL